MSKQEENDVDGDDEKDKVSWYVNQQNKTANIIKKFNIGTLQMFISPEILSLTNKERKKIDKIYYKREYTVTPSELQKSQKDYEKELALQKSQKEQKEQTEIIPKQAAIVNNIPPALPNNIPPAIVPKDRPALPALPAPIAPPVANVQKRELMIGGGLFDSDFNDDRGRLYERERERERERIEPYNGMEARMGARPGITSSFGSSSALNRATMDLEPFIASLIKFNNTGFPVNATIKARVDTFFNINLFKAFLKRLGEPIKLYGADNQIISVDDVEILNEPKNQKKDDGKKKVFETDQTTEGSFITNWYPAQEQKKLIGSVYAFIYNTPTEQEMKQMSDMGKKIPQASMLMIKEGDNYRLIGGPIDNREKVYTGYGVPSVSSSKINSVTEETTVANQINSEYRKVTGQSSLPVAITNTGLRFIYEPESSNGKDVNANSDISKLKSVIYTRQVTNSQMESIIESSRVTSTDIVKVPIATLSNILNGKSQTIQIKIDLNPNTAKVLKFLFRILEKQNLLSAISGKQKKKAGEIYDDRIKILRDKLSESSLNELDAIIRHNIRFILDVLFSTKTTFKYKGIDYIVDYLEWNNTFKQLKKVLENYKVAYYIELELFLEKLEKGKLAIDRNGTLFSSCAVKGSQIKNFWRRNFLEQNWSKVGRQIKNSIKVTTTPSITDILPGFIKRALDVGSSQVMSQLNPGVNQISFVQYCFLGQEQLIQEFKNIDNSFAGVSWKNENSWSKRKEILFNAMDVCGSDVYCFQNVQCSMESYRTIVNSLTDAEKETLEDITTTSKQSDRIKIHRKVLNQLLEKIDDPLNLLAQIYERYKQGYFFIYFFEQNYIGGTLSALSKKTALGNLTMFKSDKFELKDETDIRMGAFISKNKKTIEGVSSIQAIYGNTSFATVAYCTFKGGKYTKPSSLPGQMPGSFVASTSTSLQIGAPSKLPGISGYSGTIKVSDIDDVIPEEGRGDEVQGIEDYVEEPAQNISPAPSEKRVQVGGGNGDGDGDDEWYNQDNSEQVGLFSGLFGNKDMGKQSKVKPEAKPCKKYTNQSYIPGGQIFGIINIKLETAETLKQIESNQFASVIPGIPSIPAKSTVPGAPVTSDKKITKQMIEVLLIAAFISKFRSRYYLSSSTDINPYFMAGDFNFDIPYDKQIIKSDISNVYSQAPALALLLTRSNNVFKPENYPSLSGYTTQIIDFIRMCKILTYLYGGAGKNGRLRLNGYTNSQTLPNMFGHKYSLTNPEKINKSGLIFTTGKLILCPKEEMNKIVNSESSEGLPVYPNKSNPSNSEAIGGVFELDTVFVNEVIKQVAVGESEEQQNQQVALQDEAKRSIIEELAGRPIGTSTEREDSSVSAYDRSRSPSISTSRGAQGVSDGEADAEAEAEVEANTDADTEEIPDWTQSTSEKPIETSVKIDPDAIQIAGENLTKLHNLEYIASKAETVKGSPYKKSVFICETGKPDYNYLTSLEMTNWDSNKDKIYSDHSPIMYNINNTNNDQCGPQVAVGDQSVMSGGAFPAEIKLITWNIATRGGEVLEKSTAKVLFYFHKFNGKMKEKIEHYKSRLKNNARAIRNMMKGGYDYTLIQEGPTNVLESSLNKESAPSAPFKYKEFLTSAIRNSGGSDSSVNLGIVSSEITDNAKYFGEFYLVVNKSTVDIKQIKSLGFLIILGENRFSNDEAKKVLNGIIQTVEQQKIPNYDREFIIKDCSRLWFFVNTKSKQILISTHLSLNDKNTPKMYERQRQVYVLLNSVIFYLRQDHVYRDYDIIFSGDFNINLLQPFPIDVQPTFLKCSSVARQQTFIYTSKNNAPSSFGGENEAKYNPTNIDFTVFYPKVRPGVSIKTKKVGFGASSSQSSLPSPTSTLVPSSSSSAQDKLKVSKITYYTQKEIFKALEVTPPATNLLDNNVSVINTDYSMEYADSNIMPPGSATLLNIEDKPLNNIVYKHPNATSALQSKLTVKYMIQASPGMSGTGELITRDTLSNSVMNSLILATLNGVKNIIFPFIGGEIFFEKLKAVENEAGRVHNKTEHAKMLLKGVTDFYEFMKVSNIGSSTLEKIYFCPWGEEEVKALESAKSDASTSNSIINTVLHISDGTHNLIEETMSLATLTTPIIIDAIVNAANVELVFGNGVSSMCFAAIGNDGNKKTQLGVIKTQFIKAFKKYIKQPIIHVAHTSSVFPAAPVVPTVSPAALVVPSVSPAAPIASAVSTSSTTKTAITQINGIKKRASVEDFKSAQRNGFKVNDKIPGGVDEKILYTVGGSTFEKALKEIKAGKKESHWMWYIFPSDLRVQTPCSTFFRLGPQATNDAIGKNTIIISEYLKDEYLRKNYMTITEALYDKVDKMLEDRKPYSDDDEDDDETPQKILKEIMGSNIDYLKLKRSIKNFYEPLKSKINEMSISGGKEFITKMNILNYILNDIIDSRYTIEHNKRVEIENGHYRLLEEEAEAESSRESTASSPENDIAAPDTTAAAAADAPDTTAAAAAPDTTAAAAAAPGVVAVSPHDEDGVLESIPILNEKSKSEKSKSRVLSLEQILKLMILNIQNNVFIISGGSYNPPHNGHIKMFETAYHTLRARDTPSGEKGTMGYYGIMVVATRDHITRKISETEEILNSGDRIKLCKLACDTYKWKHDNFNSNNMLILDVADDSPTGIILDKIKKILDVSKMRKHNDELVNNLKINNLFYLCGSDFFIRWYSAETRYSVICIARKSEEGTINEKIKRVKTYKNSYLKIPVYTDGSSEEYELSSSVVRSKIYDLQKTTDGDKIAKVSDEIIKFIGLPVYCYLGDLNYLVEKKYYGDKCDKHDSSLTDELSSVSEISTGEDDSDEDSRNRKYIDNIMNALRKCGKDKEGINYEKIENFLQRIRDTGLYYILHDLSYFQDEIDSKHCFMLELFSYGGANQNLLQDMPLITTKEFNETYLDETESATRNLADIVSTENNYLRSVKDKTYKDYDGKRISKAMVIDILGFLYESESYSLYLYIIGHYTHTQGKEILIKLYSTLLKQNNDNVDSMLGTLKEKVSDTFRENDDKIPPLPKSLTKKPPIDKEHPHVGSAQLLKGVGYVNMKTTPNGNCFYNAIGMLSSVYSQYKYAYDEYKSMTPENRDEVQYREQSRVRTELTTFLMNIYNLIKGVVIKSSKQYLNSPILKYIMEKGEKRFKSVSKIAPRVGSKYFGSDSEIYFVSLLYSQPIVTVTGISEVTNFNIFYWDTYNINSTPFLNYIRPDTVERNATAVIDFLDVHNIQQSYGLDLTSDFLIRYPHSYFLIGGRGHWTYAVNVNLLDSNDGTELGGGESDKKILTHTPRFTKKRKNRYYKKDTETSLQKTTKKHKKTRRANKNKDNILKNKKHIKKTIKQSNSL